MDAARGAIGLLGVLSAIMAAALPLPVRSSAPSGCTSIADVPPTNSGIQYGAAIVGIFTDYSGIGAGCADCHTTNGGANSAAGDLSLDPGDVPSPYVNLLGANRQGIPSPLYPDYVYVVPNHPEQSLLFMKVACDFSGAGARMPLDNYAGGMSVEQIALIYDWIAEGAPVGATDGVFRGTFDIRGFVP